MPPKSVHVAAGAVEDPRGRILLTLRPDHVHQGGLWEFPGGKLEPDETPEQGLARELKEELGIRVLACEPLIRVPHDYGDRHVLLDVYRVTRFEGEPHGREGQPLRWVHPDAMVPEAFPAADRPVITALRLPDRMLITGEDPTRPEAFLARLGRALEAGIRLVQLRAPSLSPTGFRSLTAGALGLCRSVGVRLVLNPPPGGDLDPLGTDGLHLNARRLRSCSVRPVGPDVLVGASCHDREELELARRLGLDYVLVSPVLPTPSHPGARVLGWEGLGALAGEAGLPVYGLGGLGVGDIPRARSCGARGIAAIRGLWPAD